MTNANKGAVFAWPNHHLQYPRMLAESIGRTDLKIVSAPSVFSQGNWRGGMDIVVDHACYYLCNPATLESINEYFNWRRHKLNSEGLNND